MLSEDVVLVDRWEFKSLGKKHFINIKSQMSLSGTYIVPTSHPLCPGWNELPIMPCGHWTLSDAFSQTDSKFMIAWNFWNIK